MPEDITFHARDGTTLKGTIWKGAGPSVLLLHQYDTDRHSYDHFAKRLNKESYTVLSFDFRGFGESDLNKDTFDVNDFLSLVSDVKAAKRFLEQNGVNTEKIFIIGASIGANTAMNYAPIDPNVKGIVLLSPGLDYRGIKVEESAKIFQDPILLVAGEDDEYSKTTVNKLYEMVDSEDKKMKIYPGSTHGTDMFKGTDLEDLIITWVRERI